MNADDFRQLYDHHFIVNRRIWDKCVMALSDDDFLTTSAYSVGSVRDQCVHMMSVDDRWFAGLRGLPLPGFLDAADYPDRASVRAKWDAVEAHMRDYMNALTDEDLQTVYKDDLRVWHVLLHIVNHGTDHRAQLLSLLNGLGVNTFPQDFIFHVLGLDPSQATAG